MRIEESLFIGRRQEPFLTTFTGTMNRQERAHASAIMVGAHTKKARPGVSPLLGEVYVVSVRIQIVLGRILTLGNPVQGIGKLISE
jgi:hypothetical protein